MECNNSKEVYIGSTQAYNTRILLHKSNIKILENVKLKVSLLYFKHLYECCHGNLKQCTYIKLMITHYFK